MFFLFIDTCSAEFKLMHHTMISLIPTIMHTYPMPEQKYSLSTYVEGMAVLYQLVTYGSQKGTPYNDNHTSPRSSSSRCPFRRIPGQQQYQCLYIMKKGKYETFMITAVVVIFCILAQFLYRKMSQNPINMKLPSRTSLDKFGISADS